jgi:hypothetical protein
MTRPWTKKKETNHRVEIEWHRVSRYREASRQCDEEADMLNDLFKEHKNFDDCSAFTNYDEVDVCVFCNNEYEEMIDEDTNEPVCANCGKGAKEAMLEKLKDG